MTPAQFTGITDLVNENDKFQLKLNSFAKSLRDLGLDEDKAKEVLVGVTNTATAQTTGKVSLLMNEKDFTNWKAFVDTGANTAQQLVILNEFIKDRTGKNLEELHFEILDSLIKDTLEEILHGKTLSYKIANMSDEEIDAVNAALDSGDYDKVDQLVNKGK